MLKKFLLAAAIVLSVLTMAAIAPAYAQATRTWVSGVGDDANPCSRTAPCKTFAGAISKTAAKGEINCLDSGGFGAVTITKSIAIVCHGVVAGIVVSGTNGIIVNTPANTDRVLLDGLDINGIGTGLDGVKIVGLGQTMIQNTTIRNFTQEGIDVVGGASARVSVRKSLIFANNGGINIQGNAVGVSNSGRIDDVYLEANTAFGLQVASGSFAVISDNLFVGSAAGIIIPAGATVQSYGDNIIRDGGTPTQQLPKQ